MHKTKRYRYYELDQSTRAEVLQRDKYRCIMCGSSPVDVHEIIPRSAFGSANKEKCFVVKNRVCLCRAHHNDAHSYVQRVLMLELLMSKYNYIYPEQEYHKYLGDNDG